MDAREPQDLEQLLQQSNWLQGLAHGLVRDPSAADDVVQDTWVAALRHAPAVGAADLRAWLRVVARNFARGKRREAGRRAAHEPNAAREERIDGPDELAARFELQRRLGEAVLALESPYRDAIVKRYIDGLSTIQVAEQLGLTHDAARQRISRGLAKLREMLDRDHEGGRAGWMSALLPFTRTPTATITGGLLVMSLTMKLALCSAALVLGLFAWTGMRPNHELETPAVELLAQHESGVLQSTTPESSAAAGRREASASTSALASSPDETAITGQVLDPREQPVGGAIVLALRQNVGELAMPDPDFAEVRHELGRATTDAHGLFRIPLSRDPLVQLEADAGARGLAIAGERRAGERVTLHVQPPGAIEGRVTLARDGSAVAGAELLLQVQTPDRGREDQPQSEIERSTHSDEQGRFSIPGLPAGSYNLKVSLEGTDTVLWRMATVVAGSTKTCDLALEDLRTVRGSVSDAVTHTRIVGAEVSTSATFVHSVRTDARGEYELRASPERLHELHARAAGYGAGELPFAMPGSKSPAGEALDIQLHSGRSCVGRLVDAAGRPLEGVYVAACAAAAELYDRRIDWRPARSDAQGRFEIEGLRADFAHALLVRKQGFGTAVYLFPPSELDSPRVELGELRLAPALSIAGQIVSESGVPLGRQKLVLRGANADCGRWNDTSRTSSLDLYVAKRQGRSDEQGRFHFGDLAAGTYELEVYRATHNDPVTQVITLAEGEPAPESRIVLPSGLLLEGFVRDQDGQGQANVYVSIAPEGSEDCGLDVLTDAQGHFAACDVPPGPYRMRPWLPLRPSEATERSWMPHAIDHVQAGRTDVELLLEEGAWIRGRVLESDGRPASHVFVLAEDAQGKAAGGNFFANDLDFRIGVARGVVCTVFARPSVAEPTSPTGCMPDPDDAHAARLDGVRGGGGELVFRLPPR